MHLKNDDSFDRRSILLMLASVVLFATNTLAIRFIAIHFPGADGWVAMLFRGTVGLAVVFALFGFGRGLNPTRLFKGRLIVTRGIVLATPAVVKLPALPAYAWAGLAASAVVVTIAQLIMTRAYQFMSVSRGSSLQMLLPLATAVGGFFIFGERFHALEIAGGALTLLATWRVVMAR